MAERTRDDTTEKKKHQKKRTTPYSYTSHITRAGTSGLNEAERHGKLKQEWYKRGNNK